MLRGRNLAGRARRGLLWTHRWLGLAGGIVVVLIGLTGSFIVFYREIDAALNPALYAPATPEQRVVLSEVIRAAAAADAAPISTILVPDRTWPVWVVIHAHETQRGHYPNRWTTMVDPSNGKVLGRRDYINAFALKVYRLHYTLLLYEWWGRELVGVAGFMLLGLTASGLFLWWPKPGRFWRSISIRRDVSLLRFVFDVHGAAGFWALLVLPGLAITGIGLVFPDVVRPIVGVLSQPTPDPSPRIAAPPPAGTPLLSPDAIMRRAEEAKPGRAVAMLSPPGETRNTWRVQFRADGADPAVRARGAIWLDPWSGAVLHDRTSDAMSLGDRYVAEQLWLHNGATFGLSGRLLVFAAGIAPLVLFVSGAIMWLKKRPRRIRAS
ncbi:MULTISPECIES: PepSY-associated TM helix domain-containing protein [Bradyrhizobium]|uniref:PepSY domain-containing protein n=2 Tax=Nitrobacteraceae TaxID=41294 RepID=A0AAE7P101_9BRAD|nr:MULTISPECIES: PepSY-associated TM helix domain-containing protein [Bradyrhizobium]QOG24000.1 PepSY domain-containing protein [Bradyrhizobium sp. SEMIA]QOZ73500.1 PepSY domain-containing protein [Bradyrhizobium arachidis]